MSLTALVDTAPLGYDAQYTSSDTGFIYLRARVYDPKTVQFLSVDPLAAVTWARYTYGEDNPVNELDPSGLSGCGHIAVISTVCNWGQESGVSNAAAGAFNFLTFGGSTKLAGSVFGFNSACANFGTAGEIGKLAGFAFGAFDGEDEALLAEDAAHEAEAASATGTEGWGTFLNEIADATGHHYLFIASSGLAVAGGLGGVGYLVYEKVK
jgi:RHS repeat-associated protein